VASAVIYMAGLPLEANLQFQNDLFEKQAA